MPTRLALFVLLNCLQTVQLNADAAEKRSRATEPDMVHVDAAAGFVDPAVALIPTAFQAHYLDIGEYASPLIAAPDAQGNLIVVSTVSDPPVTDKILVNRVDRNGNVLTSFSFDRASKLPVSAKVNPAGEVVIAGISYPGPPQGEAAFVLKIDPQLTKIVASTELSGKVVSAGPSGPDTETDALLVDESGDIFIAGSTNAQDFPVSANAFQTKLNGSTGGFLAELSPDLGTIVFATFLGGPTPDCSNYHNCPFGPHASTVITTIGLDSTGSIVVAGDTSAIDFPVTPGAYDTQTPSSAFVSKFVPDGSKLIWSTYLPLGSVLTSSPEGSTALAIDKAGNVVIGGQAVDGLPVTPGVVQAVLPAPLPGEVAGFISKLDFAGQHLIFSTYFGGGSLQSLALDSSGTIWVTGTSDPSELPPSTNTGTIGKTFLAALEADASSVLFLRTAPDGAADRGFAILSTGDIAALGSQRSLLVSSATARLSVMGVTNAASYSVSGTVTPTELVSIYGYNIGPSTPVQTYAVKGVFPNVVDGYQVLFDGRPAPILYAGPNQLNVVVPGEVRFQTSTSVVVATPDGSSAPMPLDVQPSRPVVFNSGAPWAAALNQDQTVNSANNPAAPGTVMTIWATGADAACGPDGQVVSRASPLTTLPVSVLWTPPVLGGNPQERYSLEVLYAGVAPFEVCGVLQVNFRLGDSFPRYTQGIGVQLQIGSAISPWAYVYVHP